MKLHIIKSITLLSIILFTCQAWGQEEKWVSLFDGENLKGWSIHGGSAKYRAEDGAIVGQAVPNSPNSFLCTEKEFGDFILEFDVLLEDDELNSGVQYRSQIAEKELTFWFKNDEGKYKSHTIPADRVYGYQAEIAEGGSSGGVYDEARRAMMPWWPEKGSLESKAFKNGEWNSYRIECIGDVHRILVNGVVVSKFRDALSLKGIIGLQVHDVGNNTTPYQVRWKNIRIQELDL